MYVQLTSGAGCLNYGPIESPLAWEASTLCPLGNFSCLLLSVDFCQNQLTFRNVISMLNSLDPDQA